MPYKDKDLSSVQASMQRGMGLTVIIQLWEGGCRRILGAHWSGGLVKVVMCKCSKRLSDLKKRWRTIEKDTQWWTLDYLGNCMCECTHAHTFTYSYTMVTNKGNIITLSLNNLIVVSLSILNLLSPRQRFCIPLI